MSTPSPRVALLTALAACTLLPAQAPQENRAGDRVVLFTSLSDAVVRPVVEPFERKTGTRVQVERAPRRGTSGIDSIVAELARTKADVWWSQEILNTVALQHAGAFARMTPPPAGADAIPAEFHDRDRMWFGFAARARILMVNTDLVPKAQRPRSLWDQLDPRWKGKCVLAKPSSGTALFHLLALEQTLGTKELDRYLSGLRANECKVASGDAQLAELIGNGEAALGMTDTSDYRAVRAKGRPVAAIYPDQDRLGTLVIPNTIAWVEAGENHAAARSLIEHLLSGEVEEILARHERGQIPLRAGVGHPADVKTPGELVVMKVNLGQAAALADASGAKLRERYAAPPAAGPWVQQPEKTIVVDFDDMAIGQPPRGMEIAQTGAGAKGAWSITEDRSSRGSGRVLTQTDASELGGRFPLCVYEGLSAKDVSVGVRFKTMTGDSDRAAGLLVRYLDADNYYCCRANSLEDNVRLYRVVDGRRIELAGVDHFPVLEGTWQSMRLDVRGSHFAVWIRGACLFEADDDTFAGPGKVGLWLKGDSITSFDDLTIGPPSTRRVADFEATEIGAAPDGLVTEAIGEDTRPSWSVVANPAGAQGQRSATASKSAGGRQGGSVLLGQSMAKDVSVATHFLVATAGPGMHLAGLVARYRDQDHHYFLRINPEECNLRLYRVSGGKKKLVGELHHTTHDEHLWHSARLTVTGSRLEVLIDGVLQFVAWDDELTAGGRAGVWSAPGSETLYDEVVVETFG